MSKRIIAVFGPTHRRKSRAERPVPREIRAAAYELGALIAGKNILLTGGESLGRKSVKDQAIRGAGDDGTWVGVVPDGPQDRACDSTRTHLVVPSDLKRKRNFLEALLCDGAIALLADDVWQGAQDEPLGRGTRSEAASAFALKRPIAFVGAEWRRRHNLDGRGGSNVAVARSRTRERICAKRATSAIRPSSPGSKSAFRQTAQSHC